MQIDLSLHVQEEFQLFSLFKNSNCSGQLFLRPRVGLDLFGWEFEFAKSINNIKSNESFFIIILFEKFYFDLKKVFIVKWYENRFYYISNYVLLLSQYVKRCSENNVIFYRFLPNFPLERWHFLKPFQIEKKNNSIGWFSNLFIHCPVKILPDFDRSNYFQHKTAKNSSTEKECSKYDLHHRTRRLIDSDSFYWILASLNFYARAIVFLRSIFHLFSFTCERALCHYF